MDAAAGPVRGPGLSSVVVPLRRRGRFGWDHRRRAWWLLWSGCPGLGGSLLGLVEAHCGSLERAWAAPLAELALVRGLGTGLTRRVGAYRRRWGPDPLPLFLAGPQRCRRVLLPGDPALPAAVRALPRPPVALHWQGRGSLWPLLGRRQAVAVVGTRSASRHGLAMAEALGAALAEAGWPVVSGLAEGVDGAVHRGCLARSGAPVAVLGTPLERVYPRHHQALQAAVGEAGLLVSEQPPGASVRAGHFVARNRLQVALARAVVVVECPLRSGALHSAQLAWDTELPLWVVPADTNRESAVGSNQLLAQGATVLLSPQDLVRQLGPGPLARSPAPSAPGCGDPQLLAAVGHGASLEQLCLSLQLPAGAVVERLLALELAGLVRAAPGLSWRPT